MRRWSHLAFAIEKAEVSEKIASGFSRFQAQIGYLGNLQNEKRL